MTGIIVLPERNRQGDGICVDASPNSVAVERGAGVAIGTTSQIWWRGVEKVFTIKQERIEQEGELFEPLLFVFNVKFD